MKQFRWFYNSSLTILELEYQRIGKKLENEKKISNITLRDKIIKKYKYIEEQKENVLEQNYIYDENNKELLKPSWFPEKIHNRIQRGAICKLSSNVNSCLTNLRNKNISEFKLKHMSKKSENEYLHFEDESFPKMIRDIKSRYWYRNKNHKRTTISFEEVFKTNKKGLEIIYEKGTERYFLHYPINANWFPNEDKRIDDQESYSLHKENRIISLDPGVRKFMVGYDPSGECIFFGDGANKEITSLLYLIDEEKDKQTRDIIWRKIKNMVSELHWKTIHFLIKNYDTILLPDFRISGMVKSKKLPRITKRMLYMFSFFRFKERLKYKCKIYNKKLIIVDESYTSQTCGECGCRNQMKGNEVYSCKDCGLVIDSDVNGARNILLKNLRLG